MPEDRLYGAIVIDTRPAVEVGGELHDMIPELLVSLEVCEQEGGLSQLEVVLDNTADHDGAGLEFAFEFTETNLFALGETIRVLTGDASAPTEIFSGVISAVTFEYEEGDQPRLRVIAEDALMPWRMIRRTRTYDAAPLRDILDELARQSSLIPVITGLNDEVDAQQQLNETDLAFLRRLCERYDTDMQVVSDELHISPRAAVDRGEVTLEMGSQLRTIRVTADLAHQRAQTEAFGFDLVSGSVEEVASSVDQLGPGQGVTGSDEVERVFPGLRDRLGLIDFETATEAQTIVDCAQRRRARRFVIAEGQATGNAAIRVGTVLKLDGLGPRFSNDYTTVRARHHFSRTTGYLTDFTAECAFMGMV